MILEGQNLSLLQSVEQEPGATYGRRTVCGVIAYYVADLAYVFKGFRRKWGG